jgi:hypothetical protein
VAKNEGAALDEYERLMGGSLEILCESLPWLQITCNSFFLR